MKKNELKIAIRTGTAINNRSYNLDFMVNYLGLNRSGLVGSVDYAYYFTYDKDGEQHLDWVAGTVSNKEWLEEQGFEIFETTDDLLAYCVENGLDDKRTVSVSRERLRELLQAEALWNFGKDFITPEDVEYIKENCYKPSVEIDF